MNNLSEERKIILTGLFIALGIVVLGIIISIMIINLRS